MNFNDGQFPLIIGANPVSLLLAAELVRFGVQPIIVDSRSSASKTSSTCSLGNATLQIFKQLDLLNELLAVGLECEGLAIQAGDKVVGKIGFDDEENLAFPFRLIVDQKEVEKILINYLAKKACPIYWNSSVTDYHQYVDRIDLVIKSRDQLVEHTIRWLVASDAEQFDPERFLGVKYKRWSGRRSAFELSLQTEERLNRNQYLFVNNVGFIASSPLNTQGTYRFNGIMPANASHDNPMQTKRLLDSLLGFSLPVKGFEWRREKSTDLAVVSEYFNQRCFLIGECLYKEPDFLDIKVNQDFQDAYNLAWKIAYVGLEKVGNGILYSYERERVSTRLRQYKSVLFLNRLFTLSTRFPFIVSTAFFSRKINEYYNDERTSYRNSTLSVHHSLGTAIKAGDLLPFLRIYDEKRKEETDLYSWCKRKGFMLLLLGNLSTNDLFIMAQWIKQKYVNEMHLFYLPFSAKNQSVFNAFQVPEGKNKMVLVRPDMHIAFMNDVISANLVDNYMQEVMEWRY